MILRKLEYKDIDGILEWMKDDELNCFFRFDSSKVNRDTVKEFIDNSFNDINRNYAVIDKNDEYMGTISLKNIDLNDMNAEYAVSFRKQSIGTGLAKKATEEIIRIAFEDLKINKVYLNVLSDNVRAIKFYEKMGFKYEGEFIQHICVKGVFRNLKWFAIRRNEYEATRI